MVEIVSLALGRTVTRNSQYFKFHPELFGTRTPIFWWVHKWTHVRFILRELTSVAVALYALVLVFHIRALSQGPEAYEVFLAWLRTPLPIVLHTIALVFVVFHSVTWFNLAPRALVIRIGEKRVPDVVIAALNYVAWICVSAVIGWTLLTA